MSVLLLLLLAGAVVRAEVIISEFMASNTQTLADEDKDYPDWIELQNTGASAVGLQGWALTDATNELAKWRFPSVQMPARGFLIVFASGKDRATPGAPLHTSFSLGASGEFLALVKPDGATIASQFGPAYPAQRPDVSFGVNAAGQQRYFTQPTPGAANGAGALGFVADTKFSHDRGFYDLPFALTITSATTGAQIRYTTNGTPPAPTNGFLYASPIPIGATTVVRARAFRDGYEPSETDTQTYVFLADVIRQSPTGQPPPGWPASWGGNVRDYGMDPDVVNNPLYRATITNDLKSLPSFSIVMDLNDLFNPSTGIYANAGQDGRPWERPCSLELILPDGRKAFQINAGIRIRGGFSRSGDNPKHAFRFFFRADYGAPTLKYPLFGDGGADRFDSIDLRTFQNYSWSFQGDTRGIFLRDQFCRDTQLDMGQQGERGDFYHLYINGQYWGLYNTCERPEASFAATYYGGRKEDYDVVKVEAGPYTVNATDGTMDAWTRLYTLAKAGFASDAAYQKVQGNNPDGTRNPAYENLVDKDNLIDYMLVIFYGGNLDAPISNFLGNQSPNNWYGIRSRTGTDGFRFFAHDAEHTLLDVNENRTGPYPAGDSSVIKSSPQWIFQKLTANPEFRLRVADRIHRYFFNDGLLMPASNQARIGRRRAQIDRAVVGESARWGDAKRSTPFTRDNEWVREVNRVMTNYMSARSAIVLNQFRAKGWYPAQAAPTFSQHGGNVPPGFRLAMSAPAGTIYFTVDGSDPRLPGGAIAPGAQAYRTPIALDESLHVKARTFDGSAWSALDDAAYTLIRTYTELAITEIMYHPPNQGDLAGDDLEFIELKNTGAKELDLSGVRFTNGIHYVFPDGRRLGAGQFVVLVSNPAAFTNKYPGVRAEGAYAGRLSDTGETLTLVHAAGGVIADFAYGTQAPWPKSANGGGFSLVPVSSILPGDPAQPASWRASARSGGSPGADDPALDLPGVLITEVLTHTDPPQLDAIELFNPTAASADIGGWYLTDRTSDPKRFRIPAGTRIAPGGYRVFTEADFNPTPGVDPSFTLDSHGEQVYLFSADTAGNLTGYSDGFGFDAAANGVSFGRYVNSVGEVQYPAQAALTLGATNAGPRIGPVVINEIQFHPPAGGDEFVELENISAQAIALYDPAAPTNTWRLDGVGFGFPTNLTVPPAGLVVVTGSDPVAFRKRNQVPADVPVLGPYPGTLQDNGELLALMRPDAPDPTTNGVVFVPYITVDAVRYNDRAPWPTNAAGRGSSLERIKPTAYGNDPANWRASLGGPSPGRANDANRPPSANAGPDLALQAALLPATTNLLGGALDDGFPRPPGTLFVTWRQLSGPAQAEFSRPEQAITDVSLPAFGTYVFRLSASDGALEANDDVTVTLESIPLEQSLVATGDTWRYLDNGSNQGTNWIRPDFNDAAWATGKAQLGYGGNGEVTTIGFGPDAANKFITSYFRRPFDLASVPPVKRLTVRLVRDDGAVIYLNGAEVFRSNMPEGPIASTTVASTVVGGTDETTIYEGEIDPAALRAGRNTVAVEVHQSGGASTDLSFDMSLMALIETAAANTPPAVNTGPDQSVVLPAAAQLNGQVSDDGRPDPPGRTTNLWTQVSGPAPAQFVSPATLATQVAFAAPGSYVFRLTASDGERATFDEVTVTVALESLADWKARYFTPAELADPALSGDAADPDHDRLSNLQEYRAGTNPRDPTSVLRLEASLVPGDASDFLRVRASAAPYRAYKFQRRAAVETGSWEDLQRFDPTPAARALECTDRLEPGAPNRWYRVLVE